MPHCSQLSPKHFPENFRAKKRALERFVLDGRSSAAEAATIVARILKALLPLPLAAPRGAPVDSFSPLIVSPLRRTNPAEKLTIAARILQVVLPPSRFALRRLAVPLSTGFFLGPAKGPFFFERAGFA